MLNGCLGFVSDVLQEHSLIIQDCARLSAKIAIHTTLLMDTALVAIQVSTLDLVVSVLRQFLLHLAASSILTVHVPNVLLVATFLKVNVSPSIPSVQLLTKIPKHAHLVTQDIPFSMEPVKSQRWMLNSRSRIATHMTLQTCASSATTDFTMNLVSASQSTFSARPTTISLILVQVATQLSH